MEKHRIGKDFFYTFTLTDNTGAAIDFTNAKNIVLEVYRDSAFTSVQNYSITGNKVTFQWSSAENKKLGIYNLSMQWDLVNSNSETGYMHNFADKKNIFQIVTSSEDETESDAVNLTVTQYGGIDGLSAYQIAVKNGFTGTESEWLTSLNANITKENVEKVLIGDITTHNHNTQIAAVLTDYVMKVQGKGLSTNDLTDELLTKLNSLSNYDDTTIKANVTSLQEQLNTLLSGNASTAIESFNEIIAFLKDVSDSTTLEGIIAGISQTITDSIAAHNISASAHSDIRTLISNEVTARSDGDTTLKGNIDSEVTRAKETEKTNADNISNLSLKERSRWKGVTLNNNLTIPSPPFSIELWADTTGALTGEGNSMLVLKGGTAFSMFLYNVSTQNSLTFICTTTNTSIVTDGCKSALRHFVITADKDYNWTLFVNGMASTTLNVPETVSLNNYVKLQVAEAFFTVRTYNHALNQDEVDFLYNQGRCNELIIGDEWKQTKNNVYTSDFSSSVDGFIAWGGKSTLSYNNSTLRLTATDAGSSTFPAITKTFPDFKIKSKVRIKFKIESNLSSIIITSYAFNGNYTVKSITLNSGSYFQFDTTSDYDKSPTDYKGRIAIYFNGSSLVAGDYIDISDFTIDTIGISDEFIPQNLCADKWINSGVNGSDMALSSPVFTTQPPYLDNQFGRGAPSIVPVAAGQRYLDYTNGKNYVCCGKLNTVQYDVSHWKVQN